MQQKQFRLEGRHIAVGRPWHEVRHCDRNLVRTKEQTPRIPRHIFLFFYFSRKAFQRGSRREATNL